MSEWHAIDALNDSIERTEGLLFRPFRLEFWLRLALVLFIIGLSGSFSNFTMRISDFSDMDLQLTRELVVIIIVVFALLLFITLALDFVASVYTFVFIEAIFNDKVEFIEGFKRNLSKGFSLFAFNILVGIAAILLVVAALVAGVYIGVKAD
ncbi:MAG: hypothetical protein NTU61_01105, partial [Candidatus Altiarchaeota archaeon]|nr:hypothetical protein [Candidatus Altiarchaeota archaeon]